MASASLALLGLLVAGCAAKPLVVSASGPRAAVCRMEGCGDARFQAIATSAPPSVCAAAGDAPCGGMPASLCTDRALAAWGDATDERAVACVARTLREACDNGDPRACGLVGRMLLDGHGVPVDRVTGVRLLAEACDDGQRLPCLVAVRWLGDADHGKEVGRPEDTSALRGRLDAEYECLSSDADSCFQVAQSYAAGAIGYPPSPVRSTANYRRACEMGHSVACNNLADAMEYGTGVARDIGQSVATYERACKLGLALGCANLGYLLENGLGVARNVAKARALYGDACAGGEVYACLHVDMMRVQPPGDPFRAAEHWERLCAARDARACAFAGLMYEDGPDGFARDEAKSHDAMTRGCALGNASACRWLQFH